MRNKIFASISISKAYTGISDCSHLKGQWVSPEELRKEKIPAKKKTTTTPAIYAAIGRQPAPKASPAESQEVQAQDAEPWMAKVHSPPGMIPMGQASSIPTQRKAQASLTWDTWFFYFASQCSFVTPTRPLWQNSHTARPPFTRGRLSLTQDASQTWSLQCVRWLNTALLCLGHAYFELAKILFRFFHKIPKQTFLANPVYF